MSLSDHFTPQEICTMAKAKKHTTEWIRIRPETKALVKQISVTYRMTQVTALSVMVAHFASLTQTKQIDYIVKGEK